MIENILIRAGAASLAFSAALGLAVAISCAPEAVHCVVPPGQSVADVLIGELAIAFGIALVISIAFELAVRRLPRHIGISLLLYPFVLATPVLVPYCIGTGCGTRGVGWFPVSVATAGFVAAAIRAVIHAAQTASEHSAGEDSKGI